MGFRGAFSSGDDHVPLGLTYLRLRLKQRDGATLEQGLFQGFDHMHG